MNSRPLDGIRVLEVGQLLAGPFAGNILGYYGAEVIKVEAPVKAIRCVNGGCWTRMERPSGGAA